MMSGKKWEAVSAVLLIDHFSVDLLVGKCKQYFQQSGFCCGAEVVLSVPGSGQWEDRFVLILASFRAFLNLKVAWCLMRKDLTENYLLHTKLLTARVAISLN